MIQLPPFNFFGSEDSQDYDVMFFVTPQQLGKVHLMKLTCDTLDDAMTLWLAANGYPAKPVNSNICVVENGVIVACFKGTADEVNNSVLRTYKLHKQVHPCQVVRAVKRDVLLKVLRTYRVILSYVSRTEHREAVKLALRGSLAERIRVVEMVDLSTVTDLGKKGTLVNFYKIMAFQLGQTISLINCLELYTKYEIAYVYPYFKDALYRNENKSEFSLRMIQWQLEKLHEYVRKEYTQEELDAAFEIAQQ